MSGSKDGVLILTGASSGIGRALAVLLAESGYGLVLNARSFEPLEETAATCRELGADAQAVSGNAAHHRVAEDLVAAAQAQGDFAGVIHAAGVFHPGYYLWELTDRMSEEVIEAGLTSTVALIHAAMPALLQRGRGLFIVFGSGAAELHNPGIGLYCTTKAAEEFLAVQLAIEAPQITTVVYRPGMVETRMQEQARRAEGGASYLVRPEYEAFKAQDLLLEPEQSARGVLKILEDPAQYHGRIVDARQFM